MEKLKDILPQFNEALDQIGLCPMELVRPKDCIPQAVNARYMMSETFNQLVTNIKKDNRLESLPLCYKTERGLEIISGHHRIKAAEEAGLDHILVLITEPESSDEKNSKQLSHNSLTGQDDQQILDRIFNSISDVKHKMASGLNDAVEKISYPSLNFRVGTFKDFNVTFIPEDIENYDSMMDEIETFSKAKPDTEVRLAPLDCYEEFGKVLRKVKKVENIKSNGVAFVRMVELAFMKMKEMQEESSK